MRDPVGDAARSAGVRVTRTPLEQARPRSRADVLHRQAHRISRRWPHAVARIRRIIEGAGLGGATSTMSSAADAEYPKLAREYLQAFLTYSHLRFRDTDDNPYRGMKPSDAAKKFIRIVEDICDRSTGRMGAWY